MWSYFNLLVPATACLLCDANTREPHLLCAACAKDLPYITNACVLCGLPLEGKATMCGQCAQDPPPVERTYALCHYAEPVDKLLLALKFHQRLAVATVFGELLAQRLLANDADIPDALIPVPLHAARLQERGYNQALEIAKPLSKNLDVPVLRQTCIRIIATSAQSDLSRYERRANIQGAFAVIDELPRHVAIVDDVMTTGSTVFEMAVALKEHGAERVDVWACARATTDFA